MCARTSRAELTELDRLLARLAVAEPEHAARKIDLSPTQRADFAEAGASKNQQSDRGNYPRCGRPFTFGIGDSAAELLELLLRQKAFTFALAVLFNVSAGVGAVRPQPVLFGPIEKLGEHGHEAVSLKVLVP